MALVSIVTPAYLFFPVLSLAVAILGRLAYARFFGKERGTRLRLPPGPPLRPLVGNVKDVPEKYQDKALGRLAETYGMLSLVVCSFAWMTLFCVAQAMSCICESSAGTSWSSAHCALHATCYKNAAPYTAIVLASSS